MHNSYIMWFVTLRFVSCKITVDAFSLLFFKLLIAKLCLSVVGATSAELHWLFISICSCFARD